MKEHITKSQLDELEKDVLLKGLVSPEDVNIVRLLELIQRSTGVIEIQKKSNGWIVTVSVVGSWRYSCCEEELVDSLYNALKKLWEGYDENIKHNGN